MRLSCIDIRKAVPKELRLAPGTLARQVRCVYGTRDAGKTWEDTYTQVLEAVGFVPGASNHCIFHHRTKDLSIVVHGDDFTTLGIDTDLDWYENQLKDSFEIKNRWQLGLGCTTPRKATF